MGRILIVDDEGSIRETLGEFVKDLGHEVETAEEAAEALESIERSMPDVVLSDVILPGVDGLTLLERIHAVSEDIQVIIITGEPTVDTAAIAVRRGAFDYLSKPVSRMAIQSAVERALRVKEIVDERRRLAEENLRYREHLEEEVTRKTGALRESEERFRRLFELSPFAMLYVNLEGEILLCNDSFARMHGTSGGADAQIGRSFADYVLKEDIARARETIAQTLEERRSQGLTEYTLLRHDGTRFPAEVDSVPVLDESGQPIGLVSISMDITERKALQAKEAERRARAQARSAALLRLATERSVARGDLDAAFRVITETCTQALDVDRTSVWLFDQAGERICCKDLYDRASSEHSCDQSYRREEIGLFLEELDRKRSIAVDNDREDPRTSIFLAHRSPDEGARSVLDAAIRLGGTMVGDICLETVGRTKEWTLEDEEFAGEVASLIALTIESEEHRRTEQALERREKEYEALFENSPVPLWVEDYSRVKASLDELRASGVRDLEAYLGDHPRVLGDVVRAIRVIDVNEAAVTLHGGASKTDLLAGLQRIMDAEASSSIVAQLVTIWKGETLFEGTTTNLTLSGARKNISLRWVVLPGYETTLERVLVATTDVTALVEAELALRRALAGTIEAIGRTTETRDPYTAGHQRRVTDLAVAIAERMNLSTDRVDAVRAAGLVHDIGKMAVPAEILSKPSSLSETEMSLIKSHPQVAHDILEATAFPWPLAEIVLQHHERIDGSGYPRGLTGADIMLEARILAVADTVEAMASHRPYRAALGIDAALEEVEERRGTHYDPEIADTCLALFAEGRFSFDADDRADRSIGEP